MIGLSLLLYLLIAFSIGVFVIPRIVKPLGVRHPIAAKYFSVTVWIVFALAATWPVTMRPMLYKLNCTYLTKFIVEPTIDARTNGYLDTRFVIGKYDPNHYDGWLVIRGAKDLQAGRIAFFEAKISETAKTQSAASRYLRYSLFEAGSLNCDYQRTGYWTGIRPLNPMPNSPERCLGVEEVEAARSRYEISGDGFKGQEGTTAILDRETNKVVAIFRSFYNSGFLGVGGEYCPSPVGNRPHETLTKLVFKDTLGNVDAK